MCKFEVTQIPSSNAVKQRFLHSKLKLYRVLPRSQATAAALAGWEGVRDSNKKPLQAVIIERRITGAKSMEGRELQ